LPIALFSFEKAAVAGDFAQQISLEEPIDPRPRWLMQFPKQLKQIESTLSGGGQQGE